MSKPKIIRLVIIACMALGILFSISFFVLKKLISKNIPLKKIIAAKFIRTFLLKKQYISSVSYKTSDNIELAGLLIKRKNPLYNIVICHGYKGAKEFLYKYITIFPQSNILLFDFRAHGQSGGEMTTIGYSEYLDVFASASFLKEATEKTLPLVILGISMGGAAALKAAAHYPLLCDALIIDSSYASMEKTIKRAFTKTTNLPRFPIFSITKSLFKTIALCNIRSMNPWEFVKKIKQPILFLHSRNDTFIPPKDTLLLYKNAIHEQSKVVITKDCAHSRLCEEQPLFYQKATKKFLAKTIFKDTQYA